MDSHRTRLSIFRLIIYHAIQWNENSTEGGSMQLDLNKLEVVHNPNENRFETWVEGYLSKLDYIQDGKNFVITHVGVHPELRGQGLAGQLVEASLAYARQNALRVIPMCSYAAAYIRRNPQHAELTSQERSE
jgi:predicted GNAT family acetyltransferase